MPRDTIGKISSDLLSKEKDNTHSAEEQMREQLGDYEKNVEEAIRAGKKRYTTDFFIVVLTKKERLMKNVLRSYFFSRSSCPTPEWDQAVYHYHAEPDHLDFLWVIPSRDTCRTLKDNALQIPQSERLLLDFVFAFEDGSLLGKAKKLNGEMDDSLLLA